MATRQWFSSALRQCRTALSQQQRQQPSQLQHQQQVKQLSTTAPSAAGLRQIANNPTSAAGSVLGVESETSRVKNEVLRGIYVESHQRKAPAGGKQKSLPSGVNDMRVVATTDLYVKEMAKRRWRSGDVYAPRDLSAGEAVKWRRPSGQRKDTVDMLGIHPLDNYRNFTLISEYMTSFGRIKHSSDTGLRPVNQRKIAKTIRRAIGLGIHPSVHFHPELLRLKKRDLPKIVLSPKKGSSSGNAASQ
ncbi:hypothetical protein B0H66DRAFT_548306 [Apodospora peruviana]|uniref:Small ribosomal subunit protein bS18m n=1 Tax=Apodospora peruviana TaxID=516989 RepID=A0AAE0IHS3_9PEZI|nr:hypothetical protein B0H66DRAFT_548306 [Apodospora peruviana]